MTDHVEEKQQLKWMLAIGAGILGTLAVTVVGVFGYFQLFVYQPGAAYFAMESPEWAAMNVRMMAFSEPGDFKTAERKLYQLLSKPEHQVEATPYFLLGSLFEAKGQYEKALATYTATINVASKDWLSTAINRYYIEDAHAAKAIIYYNRGEKESARSELSQIEDLGTQTESALLTAIQNVLDEPERGDFHFELAKVYRQRLLFPEARKELQQAVHLTTDPNRKEEIENFQRARMPLKTVALSPELRYYCLAASAQENRESGGNLKLAASLYEEVVREAPEFEWAYQQLALVYRNLNDLAKSEHYARKAIEINPDYYLSHITLADLALLKEDYHQALVSFSQAQAILSHLTDEYHQPLLVNVENQLGFTHELMENASSAIVHYRNALTLASNDMNNDNDDYDYARSGIERAEAWLRSHRNASLKQELAQQISSGR